MKNRETGGRQRNGITVGQTTTRNAPLDGFKFDKKKAMGGKIDPTREKQTEM